jgi:hypothetical protein
LRDKFGNQVVASNLVTKSFYDRDYADTKIDFFAASDSDYFLDAGSSNIAGKYSLSATEIVGKSISPTSRNTDAFDPTTNHLAYKMTLNAGDFVQLGVLSESTPTFTVKNSLGNRVFEENLSSHWFSGDPYPSSSTFFIFAETSGDYYIDASIPLSLNTNAPKNLILSTMKWDNYSASSNEVIQENQVVKGTLGNGLEYDTYHVRLHAGTRYIFDLKASATSPTLDPYLRLGDFDPVPYLVENNDMNAFDHNSRIDFTASHTGFYTLDVSSFRGGTKGDYTLGFHAVQYLI